MSFAPSTADELDALELMWKQSKRVSIERFLSGEGLEHLYGTLGQLAGRPTPELTAAEISAAALRNEAGASAALTMFCSVYGTVAGDLALAHGARGGVYIAGGIAQKIEEFLIQSPFRRPLRGQGTVDTLCRGHSYPADRVSRYCSARTGQIGSVARPPCIEVAK